MWRLQHQSSSIGLIFSQAVLEYIMEGVGIALAAFTAFKEVYLLSKFISRTIASAKHHQTERASLHVEFEIEFLYLRSLGRLFLQNDGVMNDHGLDEEWLHKIYQILERLRTCCGDYAKLASEQDKDYQDFSPYLNPSTAQSGVIEFSFALEESPTRPLAVRGIKSSFKRWAKQGVIDVDSWKWAVFERRKLETTVRKFQKWNGTLKSLIPLTLAIHPRYSALPSASLGNLTLDEDVVRLGLKPHARIRQLTVEPLADQTDFRLTKCQVQAIYQQDTLTVGHLLDSQSQTQIGEKILVEYKLYGTTQATQDEDRVHQLASLLSATGNFELHTLGFKGYVNEPEHERYAFLFEFPGRCDQLEPVSLHSLIKVGKSAQSMSLPARFHAAQMISRSIGAFHADGWVHKSVRSHSVMFFKTPEQQVDYDNPYLVGFEYSRPGSADTQYTFDEDVEKNLYRHPARQGLPRTFFTKVHDIYALGVVLLEIGLWQTAMSIYQEALPQSTEKETISPKAIQEIYIQEAKRSLSHHMGPNYMNVVLVCLSGEFQDVASKDNFAMVFYQRVVQSLNIK